MFFIGIFGIDKKNEEIKALHDTVCRECSGHSCTLFREYYRFHFFFIPLISWGRRYRVVCESCGSVYNVNEEKDSYSYWDLNNILFRGKNRQGNFHQGGGRGESAGSAGLRDDDSESMKGRTDLCPHCGAEIKDDWTYCPSCGRIISE